MSGWLFANKSLTNNMEFKQIHLYNPNVSNKETTSNTNHQQQQREWPEGRSGHSLCADDNFLYVFGGYNPDDSHAIYRELWRYNTSTRTWLVLPDQDDLAPWTGASISMAYWNRRLITFGGTGYPFANSNSNRISMYCLQTFKWYDLTKMALDQAIVRGRDENEIKVKQCGCTDIRNALPRSKYGQSMAISLSGKVYIFAGTIGREFENDLHSFCLKNLFWTQHNFCFSHRDSVPVPRYRHSAICKDDRFLVLGGGTSYRTHGFARLHSFSYGKKTWKSVKSVAHGDEAHGNIFYPEARHSHVCVEDKDRVYLIGGNPISDSYLNDVWELDLKTLRWRLTEVCITVFFVILARLMPSGRRFQQLITNLITSEPVEILNS